MVSASSVTVLTRPSATNGIPSVRKRFAAANASARVALMIFVIPSGERGLPCTTNMVCTLLLRRGDRSARGKDVRIVPPARTAPPVIGATQGSNESASRPFPQAGIRGHRAWAACLKEQGGAARADRAAVQFQRDLSMRLYRHHHSHRKPLAKSRSEKRPPLNVETARNSLSQWPTPATTVANRRK
jgi:hypothetical protein